MIERSGSESITLIREIQKLTDPTNTDPEHWQMEIRRKAEQTVAHNKISCKNRVSF
jgi:hypothetical protein